MIQHLEHESTRTDVSIKYAFSGVDTFVECRDLTGSIYPENLTFDEIEFGTTKINEAVLLIHVINNEIDVYKKETKKNFSSFSLMVAIRGRESL